MPNERRFNVVNPISEDTVQCYIFPQITEEVSIECLCEKINKFIEVKTKNYIWHRDAFVVYLPMIDTKINEYPVHLASNTCFGDNIEDEWFIVHIVLELTKEFNNIIVQVQDNDGDFLLIESANHLPSWVNPDTTENRVFIYQGNVHIIPPSIAKTEEKLTIKDAIQYIRQYSDQTQSAEDIQQSILERIGKYPEKLNENIHNAVVELPVHIATLLKLKPNLIAPIVNTYCHHDYLDIKSIKNDNFKDTILVKIQFTKCLYAMLLHSKLAKNIKPGLGNNTKKVLGMKICCGFNLITNKPSDIESSKEYKTFLKNLINNGYFKDNIEGSKDYTILLGKAKQYFKTVECPIVCNVSSDISEIMQTDEYEKTKESLLLESKNSDTELVGDSDDWLCIDPDQLNELLNSRFGKISKFQNNDVITPQNITNELTNFLNTTSDFEGIQHNEDESTKSGIDFDADEFTNCVEKMLKLLTGDKNEEDGSESEDSYGSDDENVKNVMDEEIERKLTGQRAELFNSKAMLKHFAQSMKEERASSGPSSNLLSSVGFTKTDFLDSDDDE